jgi:hypothetical protein
VFKPCLAALTSLITLLSALPPVLAEDPQTPPVTPGPDLTPADLKRLGVIPSRLPGAEALRDLCQNAGGVAISQRDCDRLQQGDLPIRLNARNGSLPPSDPVTGIPLGRASGTLLPPSSNPISVAVAFLGNQLGGALNVGQYFNRSPRPAGLVGNGNRGLLFPLTLQAAISSTFGWRIHPLSGEARMHTGTDLAAPYGTPVVAAYSGSVSLSDFLGGYGLAIVIDHSNPRQQTLYGHLSEVYVQPGDRVRQGEVIGRVGMTGATTGPHLHFEVRRPSGDGWVAIAPERLLNQALGSVVLATDAAAPSGQLSRWIQDLLQLLRA